MSNRFACGLALSFAACCSAAQPPQSDPQRLHAMVREVRPPGVDVLNLGSIDGSVRLLGTAQTLGAIRTLASRMAASGLVADPHVDAVHSPKEGPHVFALSGRDRNVSIATMPTGAMPAASEW
ncbi:hypothetical protein [Chiayiivirga flava]|uniref:Uncharacterized protein n=1 Tax=Chiayiivirga flava TaxID=659595 RepID=A0A7W8D408_9GAMM|nr:hypothetical protein [Chiayiivirga flava]MBB5207535.1 hypothetical protein [Chiayiivirga flava]